MNKQIIDTDTQNEAILDDMMGDFDTFLHQRDFNSARALIDNLCDMGKYLKAAELEVRMTAAKMRVPANYGFSKKLDEYERRCHVGRSYLHRFENGKCAKCGKDEGGPEYDKYSTREYYERTEAEFGSPF